MGEHEKEYMESSFNPKTREVFIDAAIMLCLYYIIANPATYEFTSKNLPGVLNQDPVLLHAVVFSVVFIIMQKLFNKF
tara:strand:- start:594 stop:827 length:234 start_codon:yes stop_codon:yes gene_type:complete